MGVYINMEMPTDHPLWIVVHSDGTVEANEVSQSRPVGWQTLRNAAVPVPPHGDLIDRDPFIDFIKTHWDSYDQWFVDQLEARPTIIPADGNMDTDFCGEEYAEAKGLAEEGE